MPPERLNSPRNASTGIVSPSTASAVRVGRVTRFCQAKDHMLVTRWSNSRAKTVARRVSAEGRHPPRGRFPNLPGRASDRPRELERPGETGWKPVPRWESSSTDSLSLGRRTEGPIGREAELLIELAAGGLVGREDLARHAGHGGGLL